MIAKFPMHLIKDTYPDPLPLHPDDVVQGGALERAEDEAAPALPRGGPDLVKGGGE